MVRRQRVSSRWLGLAVGRPACVQRAAVAVQPNLNAEIVHLVTMVASPEGGVEARAILDTFNAHFSLVKNVYKYYSMKFTARCAPPRPARRQCAVNARRAARRTPKSGRVAGRVAADSG
jgi:hypothetical protein